ncbi:MAG: 2-hydroxyacid dehydrogenase [Negativicutes bacterium]
MSTRKKVLITDNISEKTKIWSRKYITQDADVIFYESDAQRDQYLGTADVLVTSTKPISPEMLAKAEKCIYIQKYGAGVNNIAIPEATERGIPVGNVSGSNALSVAEHAVTLMLGIYKNITTAHNKLAREGKWLKTVLRDRSYELSHKKIGIVGFGNIGRLVAKLLKGFECEILYYDAYRLPAEQEHALVAKYMELDDLVEMADIITLHTPLTAQTHYLINEARLKAMKPNAVLINTARGGLVDEKALVEVLKSGHLLGAGIDCFEVEPIDQNHPLTKFDNVIVTPHNGGGTNEAVEAVVRDSSENINAMLWSGKVANEQRIVNWKDLHK